MSFLKRETEAAPDHTLTAAVTPVAPTAVHHGTPVIAEAVEMVVAAVVEIE
uniref:hypothetical protein n=1 Tax=Brevibacillus migulae TaxID=1644114 RepID=UPI00142F8B9F|nr:hypothetical protein [Brevibacillus migulae]